MLLLPPLLPITILLSLPALPPKKRTTLPTNKVLPVLRRATDCSDCCLPPCERSLLVPHRSRTYEPWFPMVGVRTSTKQGVFPISGNLILGSCATCCGSWSCIAFHAPGKCLDRRRHKHGTEIQLVEARSGQRPEVFIRAVALTPHSLPLT